MTRYARFETTPRRTCVRVSARRKPKCAQPADDAANGAIHFNQELVAVVAVHSSLRTIRVMLGASVNAGQICTTVDHVFVPRATVEQFARLGAEIVPARYPRLDSPDFTSLIDQLI
jgi:hypothetical protein